MFPISTVPRLRRRLGASDCADRVGREGDRADHPLAVPPQGDAHQVVPPRVAHRVQERQGSRSHPSRFQADGHPQPRAGRDPSFRGDGDGRTQDGERVPPLRHRRGRDVERGGREAPDVLQIILPNTVYMMLFVPGDDICQGADAHAVFGRDACPSVDLFLKTFKQRHRCHADGRVLF